MLVKKAINNKHLQGAFSFLVFLFSKSFPVAHAFGSSISSSSKSSTLAQSVEANIGLLPESPRCWKSAVALFHETQLTPEQSQQLIVTLCQMMPEEKLKLLALEIARCHLEDLGKPLFHDPQLLQRCSVKAGEDTPDVHYCLKHLTDTGANAYTHYVSYVQQLCTRLTQELIMNIQHEATNEMAMRHADISRQSIELTERQAEQMSMLVNLPEQVKERLTEELTESLKHSLAESLDHQLHDQLDIQLRELLANHAAEQAHIAEMTFKQAEMRSAEQKERLELLYESQRIVWDAQLQEQREKVKALSETVSKTTQTIQPLLGIQTLVVAATQGYTWLTFILHFLGTFNVIWLITRPQRCHRFRSYLFGLVMTEALFEIGVMMLQEHELLTESERMIAVVEVRRWTFSLECMVYVFGLLFSRPPRSSAHYSLTDHNEGMHHFQNAHNDTVDGIDKMIFEYRTEPATQNYQRTQHHNLSSGPSRLLASDLSSYPTNLASRPRGVEPLDVTNRVSAITPCPRPSWSFGRNGPVDACQPIPTSPNLPNLPYNCKYPLYSMKASATTGMEQPLACRTLSLAVGCVHDNQQKVTIVPAIVPSGAELISQHEEIGQINSFEDYFDAQQFNDNHKRLLNVNATSESDCCPPPKRVRRQNKSVNLESTITVPGQKVMEK
ncbi:hypothetical protein MPSEU_000096200 [Mayamaea pseudoterrestris]|nr:hypothetical protein MPSEU_000096200 [Mayamaea pseudoterrestris]